MNATLRRRLAVAATILVAPALSSCGVNFGAQTDQLYTPADGVNQRDGSVDVLNALLVADEAGAGRFIATLVNNEPETEDELVGIRGAEEASDASVTIGEGETVIPEGGLLNLAEEGAAVIEVNGDPETVRPGFFIALTLTFADAEEVTVEVPVLSPEGPYADLALPGQAEDGDASEVEQEADEEQEATEEDEAAAEETEEAPGGSDESDAEGE